MQGDLAQMRPLADEASGLMKTLSHPARLMICCQLRHQEMSVGDIELSLGIAQPRLSRELAKLREDGFVETRRQSKVIFYRLADVNKVAGMIDAICAVMLDKVPFIDGRAPAGAPALKPNTAGGYGVFARPGETPST